MISAITWIRTRKRALARSALALFPLAWLQAAVMPCTMAYAMDLAAPAAQQSEGGGGGPHGGHDGHAGHDLPAPQTPHCPYCPPAQVGSGADCDHETECTFPHDPQIDARNLIAYYGPPPSQLLDVGSRLDPPALPVLARDAPPDVPRRPLAISYCRLIE